MASTAQERPVRVEDTRVVQCSPRVHTYYGARTTAEAVARARSQDGMFFVARKCQACSGWRLLRLS
ncbi:MAG TPA: hypothetical protein VFV40_01755 [Nocardioides sp.]|nr:hypothetical protein [Nocardioides sp.]